MIGKGVFVVSIHSKCPEYTESRIEVERVDRIGVPQSCGVDRKKD